MTSAKVKKDWSFRMSLRIICQFKFSYYNASFNCEKLKIRLKILSHASNYCYRQKCDLSYQLKSNPSCWRLNNMSKYLLNFPCNIAINHLLWNSVNSILNWRIDEYFNFFSWGHWTLFLTFDDANKYNGAGCKFIFFPMCRTNVRYSESSMSVVSFLRHYLIDTQFS